MKMYFYYGVMGSSKTATALMKKFSFEERNRKVALLKPSADNRDGKIIVKSRVGLSSEAFTVEPTLRISDVIKNINDYDIIIVDEAQFLSADQVDELRKLVDSGTMVMCYGLKTDYMGHLFEGSKRLIEVADSIREIQSMCKCGRKAIINARYQGNKLIYTGKQIDIGGNDKYIALCYQCWKKGTL
ncbi:MAG: Thymidine kinase [Eubacteriales bacterium SKADARSKE-1]|nr:Thymidine kinase [Eubacteriales bacterium SKADARSKE-1]